MSDDVLKFQVHVDDESLRRQIEDLLDAPTKLAIQNLFAKTIDPWVPFLEGNLSQTLEITPEYVKYKVPYAHRQYYGDDFKHTTDYHPLATAHWDEVAMQTQLDSFLEDVRQIIESRAKEIYG